MKMSKQRLYTQDHKSLRTLLREIDAEADDYIRRMKNPAGKYFATSFTLEKLLEELKKRHPLSMITRWHGQKLLGRMRKECSSVGKWTEDSWLENGIRYAFDLPYKRSIIGSTGRDLKRIVISFLSPFEFLWDKLAVLYAMIIEKRNESNEK